MYGSKRMAYFLIGWNILMTLKIVRCLLSMDTTLLMNGRMNGWGLGRRGDQVAAVLGVYIRLFRRWT